MIKPRHRAVIARSSGSAPGRAGRRPTAFSQNSAPPVLKAHTGLLTSSISGDVRPNIFLLSPFPSAAWMTGVPRATGGICSKNGVLDHGEALDKSRRK